MLDYIYITQKKIQTNSKVLLCLQHPSDRRLLAKSLEREYLVSIVEGDLNLEHDNDFDLLIIDLKTFKAHRNEILQKKKESLPIYLPVIVLVDKMHLVQFNPTIWDQIDDIIETPLSIKVLEVRIKNQLNTRNYSIELVFKNRELSLYQNAMNSSNIGIVVSDIRKSDNPITFTNNAFSELTGYSEEEVINRNCRFLQGKDRDQSIIPKIRETISKGLSGRFILKNYRKDGSLFWNELSLAPIKSFDNEITHYVGVQNNITELIETQNKLKTEKELLGMITSNSLDMISRHSLDGTYIFITPSCKNFVGLEADQVIGRNAYDFIHEDDIPKVRESFQKMFASKEASKISYRLKLVNGSIIWVETLSRYTFNSKSNFLVEIQSTTRDITERKEILDKLEQSVQEKSVLLQEVHHRVKNNLAVISGLLQIQQFSVEDEETFKILDNSISRIKTMALIHEKLYESNSLSHIEFKGYIENLVQTIVSTLDIENKISIEIECDPFLLNVNQAVPCGLILNETISNSLEHAFVGRNSGSIKVLLKEEGNKVKVTIKDNGIGLPKDFSQNNIKSMGLTIVNTLITQLESSLNFESKNGTTFSFSFLREDKKGSHSNNSV